MMIKRIIRFYVEGFKSMTVGKTLWALIILKLFIMFAILKLFFFPDCYRATTTTMMTVHSTCAMSL